MLQEQSSWFSVAGCGGSRSSESLRPVQLGRQCALCPQPSVQIVRPEATSHVTSAFVNCVALEWLSVDTKPPSVSSAAHDMPHPLDSPLWKWHPDPPSVLTNALLLILLPFSLLCDLFFFFHTLLIVQCFSIKFLSEITLYFLFKENGSWQVRLQRKKTRREA